MKRWAEDDHQQALAEYLDLRGLLWCHVPNGEDRHVAVGAKLKRMGVKPGVPDVLIFEPCGSRDPDRARLSGLAIELKRAKEPFAPAGRVSPHQQWWGDGLIANGWAWHVAYGWQRAVELVEAYYGPTRG